MAPIVASAKAYVSSGTGATITIATDFTLMGGGAFVPAAGDRLYFFFSTDTGTATLTPPSGLTAFGAQLNTDGSMNARAWYVDLVGAPDATYAFTHDGTAGPTRLDCVALRPNGNTFAAQSVGQTDTLGATSLTSPSLTGSDDERVLVIHWVNDGEARAGTPPAGMTLLQSQETDAFAGYTYAETGVGTGAQTRTETFNATESIAVFAVMVSYTAPTPGTTARFGITGQNQFIFSQNSATGSFFTLVPLI